MRVSVKGDGIQKMAIKSIIKNKTDSIKTKITHQ
jgi:hypothetical protein